MICSLFISLLFLQMSNKYEIKLNEHDINDLCMIYTNNYSLRLLINPLCSIVSKYEPECYGDNIIVYNCIGLKNRLFMNILSSKSKIREKKQYPLTKNFEKSNWNKIIKKIFLYMPFILVACLYTIVELKKSF